MKQKGSEIFSSYQITDISNSYPEANVCTVFPIPVAEGEEDDIVVYVTRAQKSGLEEMTLQKWLVVKMPKFMWPRHLRFLDKLSRTPTNKVEKYKLKKMILEELKR